MHWLWALFLAFQSAAPAAAPALYRVQFRTTSGNFTIEVHRDWAPQGGDRFYELSRDGFYEGDAFFRVVSGFVAQWGINPDPAVNAAWLHRAIPDDPATQSNLRGMVSFAAHGKNTRCTEVFVNLADNAQLDKQGFAPFGRVVEGMGIVDLLYSAYGESPPQGHGPDQALIALKGAAYLTSQFPKLDVVMRTSVSTVPVP